MKTKILFLAILCLFAVSISAQENNSVERQTYSKHNIGLGAGLSTGFGLSYRYFPKRFGVQANIGTFKPTDRVYSGGITFLLKIAESKVINLFLYQGNHALNYKIAEASDESIYFTNGIGVGTELKIADKIGLNLMCGYAAIDNFTDHFITLETGIYYKF